MWCKLIKIIPQIADNKGIRFNFVVPPGIPLFNNSFSLIVKIDNKTNDYQCFETISVYYFS